MQRGRRSKLFGGLFVAFCVGFGGVLVGWLVGLCLMVGLMGFGFGS